MKVPPRHIQAHYRADIEAQLQEMLDNHIIEESSSPWMAPAVKSGDLRLYVYYRELNKCTARNVYSLMKPKIV